MIKLLLKENWRRSILFIKNYLLTVFIFIFFSIISASFVIEQVKFNIISINPIYMYLLLIAVGLITIFKKFPLFYIKYPAIHACFYTARIKNIIYGKYILTFFKVAIFSYIIYILFNSNLIEGNLEPICYVNILFFNLSATILSWIYYNNSRNIIVILGVYLLAGISFFQQGVLKLILSFIPLIIGLKWLLKVNINWEKFLKHSSFIYKSSSIAFRKDMAEMFSFLMENSKTVEYRITLSNFKEQGSWIIIAKGLVELFRKPKTFYLMNGIIFLASLTLHSYNFIISLMLQVTLVTNIIQLSTENLLSIINKQKEGLILPFSKREILYKTSSISIVLVCIYFFIVTFIRKVSFLNYILITIIYVFIILAGNKLHIKFSRYNRFITVLNSLINIWILLLFYY